MWKQPVPTDESEFPTESMFTLYCLLIIKSANKDSWVCVGNNKLIQIKRGQTIFGRRKWAKYLNMSESGCEKLLKKLEKVTEKVTTTPSANCTIVTIKDYDSVVAFEPASNQLVTTYEPASNTSKSVKSVKSVKNKNIANEESLASFGISFEKFIEWFNKNTGRNFRPLPAVRSQLVRAVKLGYTKEDMKRAMGNAINDSFLVGDNDGGKNYLTPEYFLRPKTLEKYLNLREEKNG